MTYQRPAYEEVTIVHGGNVVVLRPSLRAATILQDKFGLPTIDKGLAEFDYIIVSEIIRAASSPARNAAAFLRSEAAGRPLSPFFEAVIEPLRELVRMFIPAPAQRLDNAQPATGERLNLAEMFATLYDTATGWLEWTPEQAWSATPTEIDRAFQTYMEKLKVIHGSGEHEKPKMDQPDPEQAARNIAAGLDPEFDRAGLRALKANLAGAA